ncbi:hypothetical protein I5H06_gp21 [Mycobacterium phage SirPhilip]|uniref:Uncharacterized protein n=1 Tax=Mycobacterium phage SirPhilip TaxID=2015824 RepID=A0A222ZKK3_9CAUD|nr:hypothetical protein I5H06_gp21 [Mycobacterium phage SirPhilip]ASR85283.1 hypothetical protein SEA_SIRPHILIP_81 [Mycobacterium phage SirPhilip]
MVSAAEPVARPPWAYMHMRPAARLYGVTVADIEALVVEADVRAVLVHDGQGGTVWALNAHDLDRWARARALADAAALGVGYYVVRP